jgi:hypothetical protein
MTKEKIMTISDYLWKILMPVFLVILSVVLQNAASQLGDLNTEIKTLRVELQQISIDLASLKTRMDYHEKMTN